jgi:hypothetical protein
MKIYFINTVVGLTKYRRTEEDVETLSGLYYKHLHHQIFVIFQATFLAIKNICNLRGKIRFILYLHGKISIKTDI